MGPKANNKNMHKIIFIIGITCLVSIARGQVSGNQVYDNKSQNRNIPGYAAGVVLEGDSVLYINTSVLLNTAAEYYIAIFGLNQSAKTLKDANTQINRRIDKFIAGLVVMGIKKENVSVDFITQTKTYDYVLANNVATQTQTGFQIKKNLIVKFERLTQLDFMIAHAAESEVYDLIKVDYFLNDYLAVHKQMINAATEIINEKKNIYLKSSSFEILPNSVVYRDVFYGVYPANQYKTYSAYETGNVNSYYDSKLIKKDMMTDNTFFYEGVDVSGYDKVINPGVPFVGIQFALNFGIKYYIKKN